MTLTGLDLSTYQTATPNLRGFAFMFARATYDLSPDTRYDQHIAAAKAAGIIRGAYHFGTAASTPAAQASAFLFRAHDAQILALDLEQDAHPMTPAQAAAFISAVRSGDTLHRKIGLYHSLSGFPSGLGQDFNWVAAWQATAPVIPWAFWQHTSSGVVPLYPSRLDLDTFAGDQAALNKLAGIAAAPAPVAWTLHVAANAPAQILSVTPKGCINGPATGWIRGPRSASYGCTAPTTLHACSGTGTVTAVKVVQIGPLHDKWIHAVSPGVTTTHT